VLVKAWSYQRENCFSSFFPFQSQHCQGYEGLRALRGRGVLNVVQVHLNINIHTQAPSCQSLSWLSLTLPKHAFFSSKPCLLVKNTDDELEVKQAALDSDRIP
jgi:hypothetical protein